MPKTILTLILSVVPRRQTSAERRIANERRHRSQPATESQGSQKKKKRKKKGAPIGQEGFIDSFLEDQMQKYPLFLPRLRMMDHLIQMVEPAHTVPHAQRLDVQAYRAIRETRAWP